MAFSIGLDLGVLVAVLLAGGQGELDAGSSAAALAPSCMATKNGLVVVLTMSETPIVVVPVSAVGRPPARRRRSR